MAKRDAKWVRRGTGALAALMLMVPLLAGVVAAPAGASGDAPTPGGDSFQFERKEAFDVLLNDSDPESDPLTLTANTQPAHGTVTCLPTGACTYAAVNGYVGPDEFDYTVSDGSSTASTTVSLDITGATPSENPPTPTPDEIVTKAGTAVTTNVLANDQSSSGTVTKDVGPTHGTATCTSAGSCTYTPAAGFTGYDGFRYTVTDSFGAATGTALITVVAANAGFDGTATGKPATGTGTSIVQGDSASWTIGASARPDFLPQQWATANRPTVPVTISGSHTLNAASVTTAAGWTATPSGGGVSLSAGANALLGEATTNALPPPLPPISQGTGGDGHVPILVGTKVYAFFHHSNPTSVSCIDRETGGVCPGYPHKLAINSSDIIGPGAVVGSRIYVSAFGSSFTQRAPYALYCWDTSTNETCGLIVVARPLRSPGVDPGVSAPRLVGNKVYFAADTGRLYCVDPATNLPCATPSVPTGLPGATDGTFQMNYDIVTHGTRVFVSEQDQGSFDPGIPAACIDTATGAPCTGWTTPKTFEARDLVNSFSAAGVANGVCAVNSSKSQCVTDAAPATVTERGAWVISDDYYSVSEEAELGTKTLYATGLADSGMACWDWTTNAPCTGGRWLDGASRSDTSGTGLPTAYGATSDGTCAVAVGDPGQVFTMDVNGASPCTSLSAGTVRRSVDLRTQRCDSTVGSATWADVRVIEANLTAGAEFDSLVVTVRDGDTGATLLSQQMVGTNGILSLSGISASTHPALTLDATSESVGDNVPWADGNPPRLELRWNADPADGCFNTTTVINCPTTTSSPIGVTGTPAGGAPGTASLTLNPSPQCKALTVAKAGSGTGSVASNPAGITCGASCSARYLSGTSITLTPTASAGSVFTGWSGGGCSGTGTCAVNLTADTTVTASFEALRNLTVSKAGTGAGTVGSSPAGITCGGTCSASFTNATSLTLTATPDATSVFAGWSGGGCSGTGTCVVNLTADTTVTATFNLTPRALTVSKAGSGTGSVSSNPAGITCGATCSTSFPHGASVTLTATADSGSVFTGWSGGGCSGTGTCTVTMTAATAVTATFEANRTLSVTKNGTGTGSVSSNPAGIACGATCSAGYVNGTSVTLAALADAGSTFTGWSGGGCSGTGTCTVTMSAATSVTATFASTGGNPALQVNKAGSGSGTVTSNPAGINCGAACSATFAPGTTVTLTATPAAGSAFMGWTGNCTGTASCVLTLNANASVTATFAANRTLTVSKTGTGSGGVTSNLAGIDCGATCSAPYVDGSTLTLTATPAAGSTFTGWSGGGCSGTSTCTVTMNADTTVTATFTTIVVNRTLTVTKAGTGTGSVSSNPAGITCGATCNASYANGTTVTLTATPAAGSTFAGWTGGGCSGTSTCTVTMNANATVTATFTLNQAPATNLRLQVQAPATVGVGNPFTVTYVVTNLSGTAAPGSALTATLPASVVLAGALPAGCTQPNGPSSLSCALGTIGGSGQRTVRITVRSRVVGATCDVWGTSGDDTIVDTRGAHTICGLGGDDTITAGDGNDLVIGDNPSDADPFTVTIGGQVTTTAVDSNPANNSASATVSAVLGTPGDDTINGGSGADTIYGQDGNDTIVGGDSGDTIRGGNGADDISGQGGNDDLFGNVGNDVIRGGDGNDDIDGGAGADVVTGGDGADTILGGDGNDTLSGNLGNDTIYGQDGNDTIVGNENDDWLSGGLGNDRMEGASGNDTMFGGDGNDELHGGSGRNALDCGAGRDVASAGPPGETQVRCNP
jgi:hypothetical protein